MTGYAYRLDQLPPYPGLRLRLSYYADSCECQAKVDTGASRTCVPASLLAAVGARRVATGRIHAYDGTTRAGWICRLDIEVVEPEWPESVPSCFRDAHVCAIEDPEEGMPAELFIGRDVLAAWLLHLDGPHSRWSVD